MKRLPRILLRGLSRHCPPAIEAGDIFQLERLYGKTKAIQNK